eukprot:TRINITY_DN17205_c0_g3_i2.p1 TRINITY_DN17205_c0_g3~~TRINITY_DN17205_c0_g3_i2.p1  ORF type:complete len:3380 (+),score=1080.35 TRINITY_DN17205_c0_g3_i2:144-10283(+)
MADDDGEGVMQGASGLEMLDVVQLRQLVEQFFFRERQAHELDLPQFLDAFQSVVGKLTADQERTLVKLFASIDADVSGAVGWPELAGYFSALAHNEDKLTSHASRLFHEAHFLQPPALREHYHKQKVTKVVAHDGLDRYFTAGEDGTVKAWDAGTLSYIATIHNGKQSCTDLCLLPKSDLLVVSTVDHLVTLYYPKTGRIKASFKGKRRLLPSHETDYTERLEFRVAKPTRAPKGGTHPDQRPLLRSLATENNLLQRLWAAEKVYERYEVSSVQAMTSPTTSVGYCSTASGGECLVTGQQSGHVHVYDVPKEEQFRGATYEPVALWKLHNDAVTAIRPSTNKESIITSSLDSDIHVINAERGTIQKTLHGCSKYAGRGAMQRHQKGVYDIDVSVHLKLLVSVGLERQALVWNPFVSTPLAELGGHMDRIVSAKFNTKENEIVTLSLDDTVRVFDVRTYRVIQQIKENYPEFGIPPGAMTYDSRRQTLITATNRIYMRPMAKAYVADKARDKAKNSMTSPTAQAASAPDAALTALTATPAHPPLVAVCFSPKYNLIVAADNAQMVRVWDAATMKVISRFEVDEGVAAMCMDKDERRLCVASTVDGGAQVWNIRNGGMMRDYAPLPPDSTIDPTSIVNEAIAYIVARHESEDAIRFICVAGGDSARLYLDCEGDGLPFMIISLASVGGAASMVYVEEHEAIVFGTPRSGCAVFNLSMLQSGPNARPCATSVVLPGEELVAFRIKAALQTPPSAALLEGEAAIGLIPPDNSTYNPASPFHKSSLVRPAPKLDAAAFTPSDTVTTVLSHGSAGRPSGASQSPAVPLQLLPVPATPHGEAHHQRAGTGGFQGGALPPLINTPLTIRGTQSLQVSPRGGQPSMTPMRGVEEIDDVPGQQPVRRRMTGIADSLCRLERRVEAAASLPWAPQIVITAEGSGTLKAWNIKNLEQLICWRGAHGTNEAIYALAVDGASKELITGDEAGYISVYNLSRVTPNTLSLSREDVIKTRCFRSFDRAVTSIVMVYGPRPMYLVGNDTTSFLLNPEGGFLSPVGQREHLIPSDPEHYTPLASYPSHNYLACMRLVRKQMLLDFLRAAGDRAVPLRDLLARAADHPEVFHVESEGKSPDALVRDLLSQMSPEEVELRDVRLVELTVEGEYRLAERLRSPATPALPASHAAGGVALMALQRMKQAGAKRLMSRGSTADAAAAAASARKKSEFPVVCEAPAEAPVGDAKPVDAAASPKSRAGVRGPRTRVRAAAFVQVTPAAEKLPVDTQLDSAIATFLTGLDAEANPLAEQFKREVETHERDEDDARDAVEAEEAYAFLELQLGCEAAKREALVWQEGFARTGLVYAARRDMLVCHEPAYRAALIDECAGLLLEWRCQFAALLKTMREEWEALRPISHLSMDAMHDLVMQHEEGVHYRRYRLSLHRRSSAVSCVSEAEAATAAHPWGGVAEDLLSTRRCRSVPPPPLPRKLPVQKKKEKEKEKEKERKHRPPSTRPLLGASVDALPTLPPPDVPAAQHGGACRAAPRRLIPRGRSHPRAYESRRACFLQGHVGDAKPYDPRAPRTVGTVGDEGGFLDAPEPLTGRPAAVAATSLGAYFNEQFQRLLERPAEREATACALDKLNETFVLAARPVAMRIVDELGLPAEQRTLRPLPDKYYVYTHQGIAYKLVTNPAAVEFHKGDPLLAMKAAKLELKAMADVIQSSVATVPLSCTVTYKAHRVWVSCGAPVAESPSAGGEVTESYTPVAFTTEGAYAAMQLARARTGSRAGSRAGGALTRRSLAGLSVGVGGSIPGEGRRIGGVRSHRPSFAAPPPLAQFTFGASLTASEGDARSPMVGFAGSPRGSMAVVPAASMSPTLSEPPAAARTPQRKLGIRPVRNLTYRFETAPNPLAEAVLQTVSERMNIAPLELTVYPNGRVHDFHQEQLIQQQAAEVAKRVRSPPVTFGSPRLDASPASTGTTTMLSPILSPASGPPTLRGAKEYRRLDAAPPPPQPALPPPASPLPPKGNAEASASPRGSPKGKFALAISAKGIGGGGSPGSPRGTPNAVIRSLALLSPRKKKRAASPKGSPKASLKGSPTAADAKAGSPRASSPPSPVADHARFQPVLSVKPPPQRQPEEEQEEYLPTRKAQHLVFGGLGCTVREEAYCRKAAHAPPATRYYLMQTLDLLPLQPPDDDATPVRRYNPQIVRGSAVPMLCCAFSSVLPTTVRGKADRLSTKVWKRLSDAALPDYTAVVLKSGHSRDDLDGTSLIERLKAGGLTCSQLGALATAIEEQLKGVLYAPALRREIPPQGMGRVRAGSAAGAPLALEAKPSSRRGLGVSLGGTGLCPKHAVSLHRQNKGGGVVKTAARSHRPDAAAGQGSQELPQIVRAGGGSGGLGTRSSGSEAAAGGDTAASLQVAGEQQHRRGSRPATGDPGMALPRGSISLPDAGAVAKGGPAPSKPVRQTGPQAVLDALCTEILARVCRDVLLDVMYMYQPKAVPLTSRFEQSVAAAAAAAAREELASPAVPVKSPARRGSLPPAPTQHSPILFKAQLLQTYHQIFSSGGKHKKFYHETVAPRLKEKYKKVPKTLLNLPDLSAIDHTRLSHAVARKAGVSVDAAGAVSVFPVATVLSMRARPTFAPDVAAAEAAAAPPKAARSPKHTRAGGARDDAAVLKWLERDLRVNGAGRSMQQRVGLSVFMGKRNGKCAMAADGGYSDAERQRSVVLESPGSPPVKSPTGSSQFDAYAGPPSPMPPVFDVVPSGDAEKAAPQQQPQRRRGLRHFNIALYLSQQTYIDPLDHAAVLYDVASTLLHTDPRAAVPLLQEALAVYEGRRGLYHTSTLLCLHALAQGALAKNAPHPKRRDYAAAARLLRRCINRLGVKHGKYPTVVPQAVAAGAAGQGKRPARTRRAAAQTARDKIAREEQEYYEAMGDAMEQQDFDDGIDLTAPLESGDAVLLELFVDELLEVLLAAAEAEQARPENFLPANKQGMAVFLERTLAFAQRHAIAAIDRRRHSSSHFLFNAWHAYSRVQILKEAPIQLALHGLKQAASVAEAFFGPLSPQRAAVLTLTGTLYQSRQNDEMCVKTLRKSVALQRHVLGGTDERVVHTYLQIAHALRLSQQADKALQWVVLGEKTITLAKSGEHELALQCAELKGALYRTLCMPDRAVDEYERVLGIRERLLGAYHPSCVDLSFNVAELFLANGDHNEALDLYSLLYKLCTQCYGTGSVHHARALKGTAMCHFSLRRLKQAYANFRRAIELFEPFLYHSAGVPGEVLSCLLCTAKISYAQEAYTDAIDDLERCLNFDKNLLATVEHAQQDEERALLAECRQRKRERLVNDNEKDQDHRRQRMLTSWLERIQNRLCKPTLLGASTQGKVFLLGDEIGEGLHVVT